MSEVSLSPTNLPSELQKSHNDRVKSLSRKRLRIRRNLEPANHPDDSDSPSDHSQTSSTNFSPRIEKVVSMVFLFEFNLRAECVWINFYLFRKPQEKWHPSITILLRFRPISPIGLHRQISRRRLNRFCWNAILSSKIRQHFPALNVIRTLKSNKSNAYVMSTVFFFINGNEIVNIISFRWFLPRIYRL